MSEAPVSPPSFSKTFCRGAVIPRLTSIEGVARGHSFYLWGKREYLLGNSPEVDIYLPGKGILPKHALLLWDWQKQEVVVKDLSEGKTVVNGKSVGRYRLRPRDHLRLGLNVLVFNMVTVEEENFWKIWEEMERYSHLYQYPDESKSRLHILVGANEGCTFILSEERPNVLGRGLQSDIKLLDKKVSRRHCVIERRSDEWWIRDLESANGTFVEGKRIEQVKLCGGEHIRLGHTVVQFLSPSS